MQKPFLLAIVVAVTAITAIPALGQADPSAPAVQEVEVVGPSGPDVVDTSIRFRIAGDVLEEAAVLATIRIYDTLGRFVSTPVSASHDDNPLINRLAYDSAGLYEARWNGNDASGRPVPSGLYFVVVNLEGSPPIRERFEFSRPSVGL